MNLVLLINYLFIIIAIGNAFAVLSDEGKRSKYDTYGPEMEEINHRRHTHRNEFEGRNRRIFLNLSHQINFSFFLYYLFISLVNSIALHKFILNLFYI